MWDSGRIVPLRCPSNWLKSVKLASRSPATLLAFFTPAACCQKESTAVTQNVLWGLSEEEKKHTPFQTLPSTEREAEQIKGSLPVHT